MARFTLTDDKTDVPSVTMHVDPTDKAPRAFKRLHLVGVPEKDGKGLTIVSTSETVVSPKQPPLLYSGKLGIWTVDLIATKKGAAEVHAKVNGTTVDSVAVTVLDKLRLPAEDTNEGLLARLFLAETASPETPGVKWTAADAKKSMQWMRLVVKNRLANNPQQFMAKGAKTLKDIVTAKDSNKVQYQGFANYPNIHRPIQERIDNVLKIANDDSDKRQAVYAELVQAALDVANSKTDIADPCGANHFLSGWMTVGHSPGDDSVKFQAIMSNQFFMMKRKK